MQRTDIAFGTCDGTGAAINVCLGWIPRFVKVWNVEDAGSRLPIVEWQRQMALVSALDNGIKTVGLSDTDIDRTVLTADGISVYNGGDVIIYDKNTSAAWEDAAGTSKEEVYVDGHYEMALSTDPAFRCVGDVLCPDPQHGSKVHTPPGFTIGADADLNADGERLFWMAIR